MTQAGPPATAEWKKHWTLVLAGMIGMSFYSVITYSLGTFIDPLEKEFGWNRAEISFGLTIFTMTAMIGGPFIGAVIDRFGTRRVAIIGMTLHLMAYAAFSTANGNLYQWFALWSFLAVVSLATKTLVWSAAVSSVFIANRSMALAVMLSGTALGQSLAPKIANWLIEDYGWREAYLAIGLGWGGLSLALLLLFFHDAREHGRRDGSPPIPSSALPGLTLGEATRDSRVLRIAIANLLMSIVGSGVTVHMVPILSDTGIDRHTVVNITLLMGFSGIAGKLLAGWLLDRLPGSLVPFITFCLPALGYFLLLDRLHSMIALAAGVMVIGFSAGAGLQVTTYLTSCYAGLRNFGKIYGMISSMMMAGASIGPLLAGHLHDVTGSYAGLLMAAIPVVLLCSVMFVGLGPYPDFKPAGRQDGPARA